MNEANTCNARACRNMDEYHSKQPHPLMVALDSPPAALAIEEQYRHRRALRRWGTGWRTRKQREAATALEEQRHEAAEV